MQRRFMVSCKPPSYVSFPLTNVDLLRSITDPEHPVTLEQLRVVQPEDISVAGNRVLVYLTPTIPHCSMSTLIGESMSYCH
jgi:metal-sulfur cluster biosynthetic enzyme